MEMTTAKTPVPTPTRAGISGGGGIGSGARGLEPKYPHPSVKRGITVGAFGGFIASIAFIGIMLWLPIIFDLPVGIFLHALGLSIIKPVLITTGNDSSSGGGGNAIIAIGDIVHVGLAAFGLILAQGIIVGIILGIVTNKIKRLSITSKKKGIGVGLATGVIAYIVLFVSVIFSAYPSLLANSLTTYPHTIPASLEGLHNTHNSATVTVQSAFISMILGYGLFAYLVYGFILGGILTWATSVYKFNLSKSVELEKHR
jgi:hypothetical protein